MWGVEVGVCVGVGVGLDVRARVNGSVGESLNKKEDVTYLTGSVYYGKS